MATPGLVSATPWNHVDPNHSTPFETASKAADALVDTLLFTQFADKKTLIKKQLPKTTNRSSFEKTLRSIEELRNDVAHANEYANSPSRARFVCKTARELLQARLEIAEL
jgi:hypothetical protein